MKKSKRMSIWLKRQEHTLAQLSIYFVSPTETDSGEFKKKTIPSKDECCQICNQAQNKSSTQYKRLPNSNSLQICCIYFDLEAVPQKQGFNFDDAVTQQKFLKTMNANQPQECNAENELL